MDYKSQHFKVRFKPKANKDAIIKEDLVRFTVLTSRLIRMEYDSANCFEDSVPVKSSGLEIYLFLNLM